MNHEPQTAYDEIPDTIDERRKTSGEQSLNYAKQTQFARHPNECNLCQNKELRTKSCEGETHKTKPNKPNFYTKNTAHRLQYIAIYKKEFFPKIRVE